MAVDSQKFDTSLWQQQMLQRDINLENSRKEVLAYTINFLNSIKETIEAEEIYLFGSILRENMFDENSDIDIALKGIKNPGHFFKIWVLIDKVPNRNIDLLIFEESNFSELIVKYGLKIK